MGGSPPRTFMTVPLAFNSEVSSNEHYTFLKYFLAETFLTIGKIDFLQSINKIHFLLQHLEIKILSKNIKAKIRIIK